MSKKIFVVFALITSQSFFNIACTATINTDSLDGVINRSKEIARIIIKEAVFEEKKSGALNCNYTYTAEVREKIKGNIERITFVSNGQLNVGSEYLVFFEPVNSAILKECGRKNIKHVATTYPEKIIPIDHMASAFYDKDMLSKNISWESMPDSIPAVYHRMKSDVDSELDESVLLIPYDELTAYIRSKVGH